MVQPGKPLLFSRLRLSEYAVTSGYGPEGRGFESSRARHTPSIILVAGEDGLSAGSAKAFRAECTPIEALAPTGPGALYAARSRAGLRDDRSYSFDRYYWTEIVGCRLPVNAPMVRAVPMFEWGLSALGRSAS